MKYTYVVWDFNGTIFDDVRIGLESLNVLLKRRGLPIIESYERYKEEFMFPIIEGYKKWGFDFDKESYDDVAVEWVNEYLSREDEAELVDGVRETLDYFKSNGLKQIIISASETSMLIKQLKKLGIEAYFEEVLGLDNVHAAGKKEIALAWKKKHLDERLLFIGDTDHDHLVAEAINADCILISSGHQSYGKLLKIKPKLAVFETNREIIDFFEMKKYG